MTDDKRIKEIRERVAKRFDMGDDEHWKQKEYDAEFIAHAPSDIAYLLSQIEALTEKVKWLEGVQSILDEGLKK